MNLEFVLKVLNSPPVNEARKNVRVFPGEYPTSGFLRVGDGGTANPNDLDVFTRFCESELRIAIGDPGAEVHVIFNVLDDWRGNVPSDPSTKPIACSVYFNRKRVVN